ncbi:MAG: ArsR/SmtB family transcription factor [Aeromicrobium sp.]
MTVAPVEVFAALGDPHRLELLEHISRAGQATATSLAAPMPVTRQAVTKHLRVLEGAGLLQSRRSGRQVLYLVRPDALERQARWLADVAGTWERRLAGVRAAAEKGAG